MRLALRIPVLAALASTLCAQAPERTNVLFLLADDLGVDKLASYQPGTNPPPPSTPVLDGLAANGVRFTRAYANPLCSPTRACLQTGRYGFRTGIGTLVENDDNGNSASPMSPNEITLAEMLDRGNSGFVHACIGKWHLGYADHLGVVGDAFNQGYDHFAGTTKNFSTRTQPPEHYEHWPKLVNGNLSLSNTFATTDNVDEALGFITSQTVDPWFCYVAFNAPHAPLQRPPGSSLPNPSPIAGEAWWPYQHAMVEHMDAEIGRLLAGIAAHDPEMFGRTLVLFMGDNGTASQPAGPSQVVFPPFDPTRSKATVFEGGIHVPLIASGYRVADPGRTSDALVHSVDLFRTLADVAGVDLAHPLVIPPGVTLDSISFLPVIESSAAVGARTHVFCQLFSYNHAPPGAAMAQQRSIRDDRYKLILRTTGPAWSEVRFYDLAADPLENNDLLAQPGGPSSAETIALKHLYGELNTLLHSP